MVTWGAETWTLNQQQEQELDTFWNKKLRHCLGVTKFDHMETEEIHAKLNEQPLSKRVGLLRLRYFGHVVRYPRARWVRTLLNAASTTTNTRGKGRPRARWINKISNEIEARSARVDDCLDRDKWQNIINNREKGTRVDLTPNAIDSIRPPAIREVRRAQGRTRDENSIEIQGSRRVTDPTKIIIIVKVMTQIIEAIKARLQP